MNAALNSIKLNVPHKNLKRGDLLIVIRDTEFYLIKNNNIDNVDIDQSGNSVPARYINQTKTQFETIKKGNIILCINATKYHFINLRSTKIGWIQALHIVYD